MPVAAEWRDDLDRWLQPLLAGLSHPAHRAMCPLYVAGLIGLGDRKSVQPMVVRADDGLRLPPVPAARSSGAEKESPAHRPIPRRQRSGKPSWITSAGHHRGDARTVTLTSTSHLEINLPK